jgi:hypothetical protein
MFQETFAAHQGSDTVRTSPSTTYSFTSGIDDQREMARTPSGRQSILPITRKPVAAGQQIRSRSISESIGSYRTQGTVPDNENAYADGFAEYHSPAFQSPLPSFKAGLDDTGNDKQPQLVDSSSWICFKCTFRNSFDDLLCGACQFRRPLNLSSDIISTDIRRQNSLQESVGELDYDETVLSSPQIALSSLPEIMLPTLPEVVLPSLPEVMPPTLPEVVPEIKPGLEVMEPGREVIIPIRTPRVELLHTQIATQESDSQALALITAREPKQPQKPKPKEGTFTLKRFSRSILSNSRKSDKSDKSEKSETLADPDIAASGFSLGGLAKILGDAAEAGNLPLVASILKLGADVNYSSRKKEVCHYAATQAVTSKKDQVVEYLLLKGLNKKSAANALHQAIILGSHTDIAMMLVPHSDFNFMWAVKGDVVKTQESCLGALSRMKDERNEDRLRLLRLMKDQSSFDADTPAMLLESSSEKVALSILCCFTQQASLAAVRTLLLQLGETYKIKRQQRYGSPHVHIDPLACISVKFWEREPEQALELARLLLKHGARLTGVEEKYTPLVPAIMAGCVSGVRLLLEMGADPECVMSIAGWSSTLSPLSYAAQEPLIDIEICHALISKGARPWRSDEQGRTALYWACRGENFKAIKYLYMLDMERSNVNKCLEAAIDSYNPDVARQLVEFGAYATAATWQHAFLARPVGDRRNTYLEIIDILLSTPTKLERELVLFAIDHQNFWGLSRILETRNGVLDFDKDAVFANPRWSGIVCKTTRPPSSITKKYPWGTRRDLQNCLAYAEEMNAIDVVALLKSHDWEAIAVCEPDCSLKIWEDACASTPPHKLHRGYTIEVAGRKDSVV